jgi:hypothetical protein
MTKRSNLEKASWVAGIVSAIIAAYALYKPDPQTPQKPISVSPVAKATEGASSNVSLDKTTSEPTVEKKENGCLAEFGSLADALRSAQMINTTAIRDGAYADIAQRALCLKDQELFEEAVKRIYTTIIRDQAYMHGVDHYLKEKNREMSTALAQRIYQTTLRDIALAKISAQSTAK